MAATRTHPIDAVESEPLDDVRTWPRPAPPAPGLGDRLADLWDRTTPARLVAAMAAVALAVAVAWWLLRLPSPPIESTVPLAPPAAVVSAADAPGAGGTTVAGAAPTTTAVTELVVQAAGAVARPGVYRLDTGSRVDDLVRRAGGLAADADGDRVNLAGPLTDGERVWVPRRGEEQPPDVVAGGPGPAPAGAGTAQSDGPEATPAVVNLNTATAEQLDTLPGVGPATATAILSYRTEHGRFAAVDDLLEVRGIGDAKLEQLRSLVTV